MDRPEDILSLRGNIIAELLDQEEYPSKLGNVAVVSDEQICFLRKDKKELTGYRFEYFDLADCRGIEYRNRDAGYRKVFAGIFFAASLAVLAYLFLEAGGLSEETSPVLLTALALLTIGARFATSTHQHILRFDMPGETLYWRSPAVDFEAKEKAAHAVIDLARERGILQERGLN